jgi:hypothetical protein
MNSLLLFLNVTLFRPICVFIPWALYETHLFCETRTERSVEVIRGINLDPSPSPRPPHSWPNTLERCIADHDRHYQLKLQQLFRVSHFNPARIALTDFFWIMITMWTYIVENKNVSVSSLNFICCSRWIYTLAIFDMFKIKAGSLLLTSIVLFKKISTVLLVD